MSLVRYKVGFDHHSLSRPTAESQVLPKDVEKFHCAAGNGVIDKEELKLLLETVEDGFACPTTVSGRCNVQESGLALNRNSAMHAWMILWL